MNRAIRTVSLAAAANASLLVGCAALQGLQKPKTNQPQAAASSTPAPSPAASATPIGAALAAKLGVMGNELTSGFKNAGERMRHRALAPQRAVDAISAADERAIGQATALKIIQESGGLVLEDGLVRYVNAVANHVGMHGERTVKRADGSVRLKARRFFVGVLDDDAMNAYALPGGYVLVTRGLLENLSCEADLAWVLAHEIAHVDNEDGLKALKQAVGGTAFLKAWSGTENDARFDDSEFFAKVVDRLAEITYRAGLDADLERIADKQGLRYTVAAGYDSRSAARVLDLLATSPPEKYRIFASHDPPAVRRQLLGALLDEAPKGRLGIRRFDQGAIQRLEAASRMTAARGTP